MKKVSSCEWPTVYSTSINLRRTTLQRTSFKSFIAVVIIGSLHQQLGVRPIEEVLVCDSIYNTLDSATLDVIANLLHSSTVKMLKSKKQEDCGLFAIAYATAIGHGVDLSSVKLDQA